MTKRYQNALDISYGACNPSGIALAIVEACAEIRSEPNHTGTAQICHDPAIRLMVNQLSSIVGNSEMNYDDYVDCQRRCLTAIALEEDVEFHKRALYQELLDTAGPR